MRQVSEKRRALNAKNLVIGLDGADVDLMLELGPRRLPHLFGLMQRGAWSRQRSVLPPATLPNWSTFLTGEDPGHHGVFDFTTRQGYSVRFTGGTVRETPTMALRLDRLGKRCACIAFPGTYPPERLEHGVFISGWDAPVAFEDDPSFVWPTALHAAIRARYGATRFDDVDEFDADADGWHDRLGDALVARIERKQQLAEWLLAGDEWDLFAVYFGESDTAAHHLWAHHDAQSPRHLPAETSAAAQEGLGRVYEALDAAVGTLVEAAGKDAEITIVSDHGSGGSSDRILYLNRALEEAGLLRFHHPTPVRRFRDGLVQRVKDAALTWLPPSIREKIFRVGGAALPSFLESNARFGAIDMRATLAFSDELNYFPGVWLNLAGREPLGTVQAHEHEDAKRRVKQALLALVDPWNGQRVVDEVWDREELYDGPFVDRAPDLLLRLNLRDGYSYNLMPSASAPALTGPWRQLEPAEFHGRKGRSLAGSHRDQGLFVAAGPQIAPVGEIDSTIADAAATLLARMGVAVPPKAAGRVLYEALHETNGGAQPSALPDAATAYAPLAGKGEVAIEKRLRALGYID